MKRQNGITLISLIITIIIMLILAGVALSMVMGDGSLLEQANAATDNTKIAEVQEIVDLAIANNKAAKYTGSQYAQSVDDIARELCDNGKITTTERDAIIADKTITIAGTTISFTDLDTSYNEATTGVTEDEETISFVIHFPSQDVTLQATPGMKWEDWVANTTYNTIGITKQANPEEPGLYIYTTDKYGSNHFCGISATQPCTDATHYPHVSRTTYADEGSGWENVTLTSTTEFWFAAGA